LKHRYWAINICVAQVISIIEIASVHRRHECGGRSSEKKNKKKFLDLTIVKSVELFDFTPNEKSEKNPSWMLGNGYGIEHRPGHLEHPPREGI
jgi:hypothetical protein